jgi:hypothetical protein
MGNAGGNGDTAAQHPYHELKDTHRKYPSPD